LASETFEEIVKDTLPKMMFGDPSQSRGLPAWDVRAFAQTRPKRRLYSAGGSKGPTTRVACGAKIRGDAWECLTLHTRLPYHTRSPVRTGSAGAAEALKGQW